MPHSGKVCKIDKGKKCGSCRPTKAMATPAGGKSAPIKKRLAPGKPLSHAPNVVGTSKMVKAGQRAI